MIRFFKDLLKSLFVSVIASWSWIEIHLQTETETWHAMKNSQFATRLFPRVPFATTGTATSGLISCPKYHAWAAWPYPPPTHTHLAPFIAKLKRTVLSSDQIDDVAT